MVMELLCELPRGRYLISYDADGKARLYGDVDQSTPPEVIYIEIGSEPQQLKSVT